MTMNTARNRANEVLAYAACGLLVPIIFLIDLRTPLGFAEWILYTTPCALAYLTSRPAVPVFLAVLATVLMIVGYYLSPPGVDPTIAIVNRVFGGAVVWILGATGYFFVRNKLAVRTQEWLQAGQVGLSEALVGEQTVAQIGDGALRYLAEYLGAEAAIIYVREADGFVRGGSYGLPNDARTPGRIAPGEGLIGQAVKDRRPFLIKDVPEDALVYGSGLSRGRLARLLISPAEVDREVQAVLEFGFRGHGWANHSELLSQVGPSVGVAIRSARYRERLQEFLEETQRQAEELQNQSDELKASNEELEEQSRALQDSQSRLEQQQAELEQTNVQLEEQTQLLEAQRDDLSRAQRDLQQHASALEQASRYKSEFLANMSHELRTPLNSLLIMARLLADNRGANLTGEQVRFAETIETAGNDLLALINDVLDIAKIEAGRLDLQPARIRVSQLAEKLTDGLRPMAQSKGLALRTEIAAGAPAEIETDPQRLEQILKNFLSNALKFTEKGEVVLSVSPAGDGKIAFTVRDTGIGIPPAQQEAVFDAFRQADGSVSRKYGGTGLGLSISRELASLLGGEIHLDSAVGRGSAFTLLIPEVYDAALAAERVIMGASPPAPIQEEPAPAKTPPPARPRPGRAIRRIEDDRERLRGDARTILVVEDDVAFARILCDLTHELGFQCIHAETADEGMNAVRQYLPHAVILDIGLPDHSGLSVLDRIKHDVRTRHIPVHVVSVSDYVQTAMALGAMSYMLKPVRREELASALEQLETRMAHRVRRVLIVEDDAVQLDSIRSLLASRDVETLGARTAAECLAQLKDVTFDCMVVDLTLPDMSGFDLLAKLSEDDSFAFPPVIVYTGRELSADEEMRLRKFSKSIIIKGAKSPERLLDEVTLFLHQVVSELPEQQQKMLAKSLNRDAALEGRRVLVVEDDVRNVFAITAIFEPHGVDLHVARNGVEALQTLQQASDGAAGPIDLVLMDIMMPEMDGLTCMREIRSRPEWRDLPIIALTAKAMQADQEKCLAAGANDYLAKPLDVDKLLSLVRVWMPR
jgi:signal transduction histidine kinase/DNA-binding response OmpR family regulator